PWALTGGSPATFRAHRKAWENIKRKDIWDKPLFTAADALRRHLEEAELPLVHPNFREHFPWLAAALVGSNR
ncbi:MAG: hypothetical protein LBH41_02810, partial [Rickettsiales bacterium]|nr:hypothetical protein [Rickettsiales bacterium]